ncbi:hypothetical protein FQN55_006141 [Onygenales sp. PD_40]|nr:hypothetical protein FQN55_006141 [Onygenales sp. PD_40]KAK2795481.1 hypothetical protein FQN52_005248 [Onygenales sp. PD_12]
MTISDPPLNPTTTALLQLAKARRSIYKLSNSSPVPDSTIQELVDHAVLHMPSGFNTQSTRVALMLHEEHVKLWDVVVGVFEGLVAAGKVGGDVWESQMRPKLEGMRGAYGTVLFFEDPTHIAPMAEKFPKYKDLFPDWAQHANAMHQYYLWLAFQSVGLSSNLQHYNPHIDDAVIKTWDLPSNWKLTAQLVFGTAVGEPKERVYKPLEERVRVFGAKG